MIDFRYHLVSLISVFLALAVGIVLGAGPLNEPIARGLSESVNQLRQEQASLNDQLRTAQAGSSNRDTFIRQIEPGLVADQLGGRSVVLITLPGFDGDAVKPLMTAITASGAKLTGRIDVQSAWVDPNDASARTKALQSLGGVGAVAGSTGTSTATPSGSGSSPTRSGGSATSTQVTPAELLARSVLTSELSASDKTDANARSMLDGLAHAGLIDVIGDPPTRAMQAVLLVPGVSQAVQGSAPSPTPSGTADSTPAWLTLARVLDARSTGAVVVGPASSATSGGLIAAVRSDSQLSNAVSTVDTGGTPMGDVTTVFALREQQLGRAGQYGFGDGAKTPLPTSAGGS